MFYALIYATDIDRIREHFRLSYRRERMARHKQPKCSLDNSSSDDAIERQLTALDTTSQRSAGRQASADATHSSPQNNVVSRQPCALAYKLHAVIAVAH